MTAYSNLARLSLSIICLPTVLFIAACNTVAEQPRESLTEVCPMPEGHSLSAAFSLVQNSLTSQNRRCAPLFDVYWQRLLEIAEGDPEPGNKQLFSDFLVAISDEGVISERQAQNLYNRYFNIKYVSLIGDYSICSQACPARKTVMSNMAQELADKEQGLLRIGSDRSSYQRADQLLKEAELVLEATCSSCAAVH